MIEQLKKICFSFPNRIAYQSSNDSLTYMELWIKANSLAHFLKEQGDTPVIVYGHKQKEMILSFVACLISNRPYVPIDTFTPRDRIRKIITITSSDLLINNSNELMDETIKTITLNSVPDFPFESNYEEQEKSLAYIIFTSGSTGEPKGVPISHKNLFHFINWISDIEDLKKKDNLKILNQASFSFDLSVADLYYTIFNAHTLIATTKEEQSNLKKMFEIIKKEQINVLVMTPTAIKLWLFDPEFYNLNYPYLKIIYFCGESLDISLAKKIFEKFPDITILNAYGPTEATSAVSVIPIDQIMLKEEILPIGKLGNCACNISIENEEIVLSGSSVFSGYLNGIKGGHYQEDGIDYYRTGDIGYLKNDVLYCKGRKDNQIKLKGYRIELEDIEQNIKKIVGVDNCIVVPIYQSNTNTIRMLKAYVSCSDIGLNDMDIRKKIHCLLPEYMIPKLIEIVDSFPINQNGKIDRKKMNEYDRYKKIAI